MATELIPRIGDRVELLAMPDDPDPIPIGARGTVENITTLVEGIDFFSRRTQVAVMWDSGRTLALCMPPDRVRILDTDT